MANDRHNAPYTKMYVGTVINNSDYQNMGRLVVTIPELVTIEGGIIVSYASPFLGSSDPTENDTENTETFEGTQTSYGFWAVPPTLNSQVLVMFANGEPSRGYWFACVSQAFMNHMIPNIPVGDSHQYGEEEVPVAEFNKFSTQPNKQKGKRPYHKPFYETVRNQGLKRDRIRGFSRHGAASGGSSRVMGLLSPNGHSFSIEDTQADEKIRLRTKSGVQVLLDDTNGLVYVINKSGTGWVEIDDSGKIMVYGEQGIAFRTKGDFSVRADRDIILESGRDTYVHSNGDVNVQTNNVVNNTKGAFVVSSAGDVSMLGANLHCDFTNNIETLAGANYNIGAASNINLSSNGNINQSAAMNFNASGGANATISGNAQASLSGNAGVIVASSGSVGIGGAAVMNNMGAAFIAAEGAAPAAPAAILAEDFVMFDKVDVEQPKSDEEALVSSFPTIVTTLPTHEPCQEHGAEPENLAP